MCLLFGHHWYNDINYVRGRKYAYYSKFNNASEIYNDFVAHERPEHESQQAVVDFLMARWRNPLSYAEASLAAKSWIETTKSDGQHWASWIPPSLILTSKPRLKQPQYQPTSTDFWRPQPQSRLLSLPAEILDMIISFTITPSHTPPLLPKNKIEGIIITSTSSLSPPLSLTCRQLSTHALPLYLGENTFVFYLDTYSNLRLAQKLLTFIGDRYVRLLQNIVLLGFIQDLHQSRRYRSRYMGFMPVRIGINLRSLEFKVDMEKVEDEMLKEEWKRDFKVVMEELKVASGGYAIGEALLRHLLGIFARECVDTGTGRRIDWYA